MDTGIPEGLAWNEAELESGSALNGVLVSLLAFAPHRVPVVAGTAFALNVTDEKVAVFCTAAHVVEQLRAIQQGPPRYHPSTPPEFRPQPESLKVDRKLLRAMFFDGKQINVPIVEWLAWDELADLAFLGLRDQRPDAPRLFNGDLRVTSARPDVGARVAILGYDGTVVVDAERDGRGFERFSIARRLVLRAGTVVRLHAKGHALCRGPCFETTIPVSPGMSGSPVVQLAGPCEPMTLVGVVSSSPSMGESVLDRRVAGASIIAQITPEVTETGGTGYRAKFTLGNAQFVISPDVIKPLDSTDAA